MKDAYLYAAQIKGEPRMGKFLILVDDGAKIKSVKNVFF